MGKDETIDVEDVLGGKSLALRIALILILQTKTLQLKLSIYTQEQRQRLALKHRLCTDTIKQLKL